MKNIFSILFFLLFFSCGEGNPETEKTDYLRPLEGSWVIRRGTGPMADRQIGQVFTFQGDKFQFNKDLYSFTGDVSATENTFTVKAHKNPTPKTFNYRIENDTMILKMENSELTFYLVKVITN